jgi:hypothetical protein
LVFAVAVPLLFTYLSSYQGTRLRAPGVMAVGVVSILMIAFGLRLLYEARYVREDDAKR